MRISKEDLKNAKPEHLCRLAIFLKLKIDGLKPKQIRQLLAWYIRRYDV